MSYDQQAYQKEKHLHLKPDPQTQKTAWTWQSLGAACGLAGGFVCLSLGGLCTALGWLIRTRGNAAFCSRLGTILLCLTIPLFLLGAHYLDLADRAEKKQRAT